MFNVIQITIKNNIPTLTLICLLLASCSLKLTESRYGEYSSYEKYKSNFKVKNREGLELGEERIPRVKKQIYRVRLSDSTIMDLQWVTKRPLVGGRHNSHIDSSLSIDYLSKLNPLHDSIVGTYRFSGFKYKPSKIIVPKIDSTEHRIIQELRKSPPVELLTFQTSRQIQIFNNGRCYYSDYYRGGPDSGGGRSMKYFGHILVEGDTITAVLYRDVLYKMPIKPFEIKLVKSTSNDTLQSVIDGEVSSQYGYVRIE